MQCTQYNTTQNLWSADSRAIIGRMTADIQRLSADSSLIKCHRPTVCRSSADWRPTIGRPSSDIMMKNLQKSADCRPIIGRQSPDASPMTKPLKIGGSVNETFNLGASTKKVVGRPKNLRKSVPTSADFPIFGSPTVGLGNVTVV